MRDNHKVAHRLFEEAERIGLDAPTEEMVAECLMHHESNLLNEIHYELSSNQMDDAAKHIENLRMLIELEKQEEGDDV